MNSCSFIETRLGIHFTIKNFHPDMLDVDDIIFALSNLCRYTGHCDPSFYVAEHCVLVSSVMRPELQFAGLLHDGAESFLNDLNPMIKSELPRFQAIEREIQSAIYEKYFGRDLSVAEYREIKYADRCVLKAEARVLFASRGAEWGVEEPPAPVDINCWTPSVAYCKMKEQWDLLARRKYHE